MAEVKADRLGQWQSAAVARRRKNWRRESTEAADSQREDWASEKGNGTLKKRIKQLEDESAS